jgi:hypothetical protein
LASARTTCRPKKPDPPNTVTSVSRFVAMGVNPAVKNGAMAGFWRIRDTPSCHSCTADLDRNLPI